MFLFLTFLYPTISIVPTKNIDAFWHTHILDTALYAIHCDILFGKFLHHFPYFGVRGEQDKANLNAAFEVTKSLFVKHSSLLNSESISASCGVDCGSSLCDNNACDSNSCGGSSDDELTSLDLSRPSRSK